MKPSFALNFTQDGIGLLHRTARGWLLLGEAAINDPALSDSLGYLRATALGLEPRGIATKLIIPNSEILYTNIEAPGPEAAKRRTQIQRGLEGLTPYPTEDLVFDWSGSGPVVQVAVVARETLAEAEAFARENRFNPLSFVAIPGAGAFDGEPFFGPTSQAAASLPHGEKLERDRTPVRIIGGGDSAAVPASFGPSVHAPDLLPETVAPDDAVETPFAISAASVVADADLMEEVVQADAGKAQIGSDHADDAHPIVLPLGDPVVDLDNIQAEQLTVTTSDPAAPDSSAPSVLAAELATDAYSDSAAGSVASETAANRAARRKARHLTPHAAARPTIAAFVDPMPEAPAMFDVPQDEPERVPSLANGDNAPAPTFITHRDAFARMAEQPLFGSVAARMTVNAAADPSHEADAGIRDAASLSGVTAAGLPLNGEADPVIGFSAPVRSPGRANGPARVADPRAKLVTPAKSGNQTGQAARFVPLKAKTVSLKLDSGSPKVTAKQTAPRSETAAEISRRDLGSKPAQRGKPRYLGLILTLLLLAFLAAVAIWSTYFLSDRLGSLFGSPDRAVALSGAESRAGTEGASSAEPAGQSSGLAEVSAPVLLAPARPDPAREDSGTLPDDGVIISGGVDPEPTGLAVADTQADVATLSSSSDPAAEAEAEDSTALATEQFAILEHVIAEPSPARLSDNVEALPAETDNSTATMTGQPAPLPEPEPAPELDPTTLVETSVPSAELTTATAVSTPEPGRNSGVDAPVALIARWESASSGPQALPQQSAFSGDVRPLTPVPPAPFGTFFERDAQGFVVASPEGALTPEGALVFAGRPSVSAPPRSAAVSGTTDPAISTVTAEAGSISPVEGQGALSIDRASAVAAAAVTPADPGTSAADADTGADAAVASDPALADFRPRARPANLIGPQDDTALRPEPQIATTSTVRPKPRFTVFSQGTASAAPLLEQVVAGKADFATASLQAVAVSSRPSLRPRTLSASIEAALAETSPSPAEPALTASATPKARPQPLPEPEAERVAAPQEDPGLQEDDQEPELASAAPAVPTKASVAKQATFANAINLSKVNLIGVYGTPSMRYALVRLGTGRVVRVKVGDRVDGGKVAAIGDQELRYMKNGRNVVLAMPRNG